MSVSLCFLHVVCSLGRDMRQQGRVQRLKAHEYILGSKRVHNCFSIFVCKFCVLQEGTCVRCIEYSGDGCTSTASLGRGVQYCFPMFSACFLFLANGHVPARSITAVKGPQVQLRQQEEYMTVFLYLSANFGLFKKVQV